MKKYNNKERGLDHLLGDIYGKRKKEVENRIEFFEKCAEQEFEAYCEKNNPSKGEAAIAAVSIYAEAKLTPPAWSLLEIHETWKEYNDGFRPGFFLNRHIKDWKNYKEPNFFDNFHEALGIKERKTKSDRAKMKKDAMLFRVYALLKALSHKGYPIDKKAFEIVGQNLAISPSQCEKYYQSVLDSGFATIGGGPRKQKKHIETIWDPELNSEVLDAIYDEIDINQ